MSRDDRPTDNQEPARTALPRMLLLIVLGILIAAGLMALFVMRVGTPAAQQRPSEAATNTQR